MSTPEDHKDIEHQEELSPETALAIVEEEPDYYEGFPCFEDLGGLDYEIAQLKQSFLLSQHPALCKEWNIDPVRGIMLCWPGGVGKTDLVRALARETSYALEIVTPSSIQDMWHGETVRKLKEKFVHAASCNFNVILFFDEFDGLFSANAGGNKGVQASLVSEMKSQMNDVPDNVIVIAATNDINNFDPALLRPGRFDSVIQIPLPDHEARRLIFIQLIYKNSKLYDLNELADSMEEFIVQTDGMSGADIMTILKTARTKKVVSFLNDEAELSEVTPSDIRTSINFHRKSRPSI
jgi:transitional endoplasmic reticulum ATPase